MSHVPVLLHEVLELLDPKPGELMADGTLDGGGHAAAILAKLGPKGKFLGVDWDGTMIEAAKRKFSGDRRVILAAENYANLPELLRREKLPKVDGLLLDLGFSSTQLAAGRGFSFASPSAAEEPLLMTYADERTPVAELLRSLQEEELANVIYEFGGERLSRRIAKAIKAARRPIQTAGELRDVVVSAVPRGYEQGRIHPATRTFQALRIYANDELGNVKKILESLTEVIAPGGRVAIISFHSLEDKLVKQAFRELAKRGVAELLAKKPIEASREEVLQNPRSRSAKLRAIRLT